MPEWMSHRFMAPVYALLISFGTALVLGLAMKTANTPAEHQSPAAQLTIHLVTKQLDERGKPVDVLATELKGTPMHLYRAASDAPLEIGKDGALTVTPMDGQLVVCVSLPKDWTAVGALSDAAPDQPCWEIKPKTGDVYLSVARER